VLIVLVMMLLQVMPMLLAQPLLQVLLQPQHLHDELGHRFLIL
jgi:hypothetical protein